ncbi:M16 family metallopeptidase [Pedobacter borealis]|uniref:M16 family metallopeptidase n=1 Tax=Pedobacter borealis TaxID=475254 RepID=UPI000493A191|nr:M16 family metallopeptidase [Pedobacter borealis]
MKHKLVQLFIAFCYFLLCVLPGDAAAQNKYNWKEAGTGKYKYRYVTNDPEKVRFYTLENGLQVILHLNKKEPRVTYKMIVRTGSNNDPADHTGLAHYLEHLLFKGTDKFGTLNWEKEKPYLGQIEELYEAYNHTSNEGERKTIYRKIDSISGIASKYAIANEYTNIMKEMGSQGTNAHTEFDATVYDENIPAAALDKLLKVQAERFRNPIFRLFHTELEAVYEEKNKGLDGDEFRMFETVNSILYPHSNYGQQTTIGTIEHLKNPSLRAIKKYYDTYYVPNNMGLILSGDFNPDEVIQKIDQNFSYMRRGKIIEFQQAAEPDFAAPVVKEIVSPTPEMAVLAFRVPFKGTNSKDELLANLLSQLCSNGKAGLFDINLTMPQKMQMASIELLATYQKYNTVLGVAMPKAGQTADQALELLWQEIKKVQHGDFDEKLLTAIKNNMELGVTMAKRNNMATVMTLERDFIADRCQTWDNEPAFLEIMNTVSKQDIVDYANRVFSGNYACIYKRKGKQTSATKMKKPKITPITINKTKRSAFAKNLDAVPVPATKPVWINFEKVISKSNINNARFLYVTNKENGFFELQYRFNMGSWNSNLLPVAVDYLSLLGTDKYSAEEISREFYQMACEYSIRVSDKGTSIVVSGIQKNFDKAVALLEHLLANCKPSAESLDKLKEKLKKERTDTKTSKEALMQALVSYATYGANNPFNQRGRLQPDQLDASTLANLLHGLTGYKHLITYYGPESLQAISQKIKNSHPMPSAFLPVPAPAIKFQPCIQEKNEVYTADFDMLQTQIQWIRNIPGYQPSLQPSINLFNSYFGGGMGSVVFQQLRESKALAYSTSATFQTPAYKNDPYQMNAFIGCQADKMDDAINGMDSLLNDMPRSDDGIKNAKMSLRKSLETQRFTDEKVVDFYLVLENKGITTDFRQQIYERLGTLNYNDLKAFTDKYIAHKKYAYCIMGSKEVVEGANLKKYGDVKKLTLEELFGY